MKLKLYNELKCDILGVSIYIPYISAYKTTLKVKKSPLKIGGRLIQPI